MKRGRMVLLSIVAISLILISCVSCISSSTKNTSTTPTIAGTNYTTGKVTTATKGGLPLGTDTSSTSVSSGTIMPSSSSSSISTSTRETSTTASGELIVHYINVGQADSTLIQQGSSTMLIDAGNNSDDDLVVSYIKKLGILKLDYVIGTHPHEDHIGGLDTVIKTFSIGKIILPEASSTTQTFEDVLLAIQSKGLKITKAVMGNEFSLNQAKIQILGPVLTTFSDLNDASVVCKIIFGETSFLFEGDAELASENAMISKGLNLAANVVKIGHHGSSSSTCDAFLSAVKPKYAVICVGKENQYSHPTSSTLNKLKAAEISLYRTDMCGTVIATSNGKTIAFNATPGYGTPGQTEPVTTTANPTTVKPTTVKPTTKPTSSGTIVYITNTGSKYHRDGCRYLSKSKIAISKADAIAQGLSPCSVCNP